MKVFNKVTTANIISVLVIVGTMVMVGKGITAPEYWGTVVVATIILYLFKRE